MPTIRPANEADHPQIVAILNANRDRPLTEEQFAELEHDRTREPGFRRLVAVLPDGLVAGFGAIIADEELKERHFGVNVQVDGAHRRQGIGGALCRALAEWARSAGAVQLEATILETAAETLAWAGKMGFVTEGHLFRAELQLDSWTPGALQQAVEGARQQGICFVTLEEHGPGEENLRRFHQYCVEGEGQVPGRCPRMLPYERWRDKIAGDPGWDPACVLLALDGERWAGLSYMEKQPDGSWYTRLTAVHPDYRGRGLGRALKVAAVQLAKSRGVLKLSTYNHTVNRPMVAINRQLGYVPVLGLYQIALPLS